MIIWSEFPMEQYRGDDHRDDASHFIKANFSNHVSQNSLIYDLVVDKLFFITFGFTSFILRLLKTSKFNYWIRFDSFSANFNVEFTINSNFVAPDRKSLDQFCVRYHDWVAVWYLTQDSDCNLNYNSLKDYLASFEKAQMFLEWIRGGLFHMTNSYSIKQGNYTVI